MSGKLKIMGAGVAGAGVYTITELGFFAKNHPPVKGLDCWAVVYALLL